MFVKIASVWLCNTIFPQPRLTLHNLSLRRAATCEVLPENIYEYNCENSIPKRGFKFKGVLLIYVMGNLQSIDQSQHFNEFLKRANTKCKKKMLPEYSSTGARCCRSDFD